MRKKLLLINPRCSGRAMITDIGKHMLPPLGLAVVAALTPDTWDIEILDENHVDFTYQEADMVGLTSYTVHVARAYEIASMYRKAGITTVMGGIHVSTLPEEAGAYVDAIVIGEAEGTWRQVIKDFEQNHLKHRYQAEHISPDNIPIPRYDLLHPNYTHASVQTSRGCPMDCEFCSVTTFNGHKFRQRPVEQVLVELERLPQKKIFFVDDNLLGNSKASRERAIALFKGMISRNLNKRWVCQTSLSFGENEEVLKYAAESGCISVMIGVEAEDSEALAQINKSVNLRIGVENYERIFQRINDYGIAVYGEFMFGMDSDTKAAMQRRAEYIAQSRADVTQVTCLTPLPGTRLMKRLSAENRLFHTNYPEDWQYYDLSKMVFQPKTMEAHEFMQEYYKCLGHIYSIPTILRKALNIFLSTKSPRLFLRSLWFNYSFKKAYSQIAAWEKQNATDKTVTKYGQ